MTKKLSLTKKWMIILFATPIALTILLSIGQPQWGKWFYMWQAYTLNSSDSPEFIPLPKKYSGEWRNWHPNGKLATVAHYEDGKNKGVFKEFDSAGVVVLILAHQEGKETKIVYSKTQSIDERAKYAHLLNTIN